MDKRAIIGFVIIFAIIMFFTKFVFPPPAEQQQAEPPIESQYVPEEPEKQEDTEDSFEQKITSASLDTVKMAETMNEPEREISIETEHLKFLLSSKGGNLKQVVLKDHIRYDGEYVSLIGEYPGLDWAGHGALTLGYRDQIPAFNDLNFKVDGYDLNLSEAEPEGKIKFTYVSPGGSIINKTYTFYFDSYLFDLDIDISSPQDFDMSQGVTIGWFTPLEPTEKKFADDKSRLGGFFYGMDNFDYRDDLEDGKLRDISTGSTDWVATRTKYFTAIIIARDNPGEEVIVLGDETVRPDPARKDFKWPQFGIGLTYPNPTDNYRLSFSVYTGPNNYDLLKSMGKNLSSIVYMGWKFFRPFAIFIHWVFGSLYLIIPNYGWVIVIFSFLMKLVFWPLSHKSAKSMHQMKQVQPMLQELKGKFKDDPAKLQKETMKIYKEYGVNPFGSCLPMLVQLPIFWAMFAVLSNSIELRGAPFILWITDLSQPDPTGEIFFVGILPILMGIAMFVQQKMTVTDPKQKMMVYILPVVFTFLFSKWASGLVLYWTIFSIMGIVEQWFVKRKLGEGLKPV